MKKTISFTLLFALIICSICLADPVRPLPVYIFGYAGAGTISGCVLVLKGEAENIDLDDEDDKELIKLLETTLESLEKKCNLFEKDKEIEPVEITQEYNDLLKINKEIKLTREHILMTEINKLTGEIEKENKENNEELMH